MECTGCFSTGLPTLRKLDDLMTGYDVHMVRWATMSISPARTTVQAMDELWAITWRRNLSRLVFKTGQTNKTTITNTSYTPLNPPLIVDLPGNADGAGFKPLAAAHPRPVHRSKRQHHPWRNPRFPLSRMGTGHLLGFDR